MMTFLQRKYSINHEFVWSEYCVVLSSPVDFEVSGDAGLYMCCDRVSEGFYSTANNGHPC